MNRFRSALQTKTLIRTAELSPAPSMDSESLLASATCLAPVTDGVIIGESSTADPGISQLALSPMFLKAGLDPIPRLNCRDRNRIALQSDLLGLKANGVTSVLLEEGGPLPGCKPVYDTHLPDLVRMATSGDEEGADEGFSIGTLAVHTDTGPVPDSASLSQLGLAGARFLVIEPIEDSNQLRNLMSTLVNGKITWSYSVLASFEVPDELNSSECRQMADHIREVSRLPGISGVNLRLSHRAETARRVLEEI